MKNDNKLKDFFNWIQNETYWDLKRDSLINDENLSDYDYIDLEYERNYSECIYDEATIYPKEMRISGFISKIYYGRTEIENFDLTFDEFKIFWLSI